MLGLIRRLFVRQSADPFAHPFGDIPPLPAGSILDGSAQRAALADQGSGGDGNTSRAPPLPAYRGRERRAY